MLAQVERQVAGDQLCAAAGVLYGCSDPARTPLCWDSREQLLVTCVSLPRDKDGTLRRTLYAVAGNAWDITTTGVALNACSGPTGATCAEGNRLIPTPEIRWGAKALTVVAQVAGQEFIARALHRPRLATWIARGSALVYGVVGLRNLDQARKARGR